MREGAGNKDHLCEFKIIVIRLLGKLRWKTFGKLVREVVVEDGGLKMSHLGTLGGSVG